MLALERQSLKYSRELRRAQLFDYQLQVMLFLDVSSSLRNPWKKIFDVWKPMSGHLHSSSDFTRVPASSSSPVYNIQFRCLCKECISGSFRIEVLPVRLRLLPFRTTIFNLRNNLFYDDFIWSWRQTTIWSLNYWVVILTFGFHGDNKFEFRWLKFKILSKTFFKF